MPYPQRYHYIQYILYLYISGSREDKNVVQYLFGVALLKRLRTAGIYQFRSCVTVQYLVDK